VRLACGLARLSERGAERTKRKRRDLRQPENGSVPARVLHHGFIATKKRKNAKAFLEGCRRRFPLPEWKIIFGQPKSLMFLSRGRSCGMPWMAFRLSGSD